MSNQLSNKRLEANIDGYTQLHLKTVTTTSIGACAFIMASMGVLFSTLYPINAEITINALSIMDKPLDQFLKAALSSIIAIAMSSVACVFMHLEESGTGLTAAAQKFISKTGTLSAWIAIISGCIALYFCVSGFIHMIYGVENILAVMKEISETV